MTRADARPRVHIWPSGKHWTYSKGPVAMRQGGGASIGEVVDQAIANGIDARGGVVVIVEPVP